MTWVDRAPGSEKLPHILASHSLTEAALAAAGAVADDADDFEAHWPAEKRCKRSYGLRPI